MGDDDEEMNGKDAVEAIVAAIESPFQFRTSDSGAAAEVLEFADAVVTVVDLTGRRVSASSASALLEALWINETVMVLRLSCNGPSFGDDGAKAVGLALQVNQSLKEISLSRNGIGDAGAIALAEGLEANSTLEDLYLSCNDIGDTGASAIADAIEANRTLKELSLVGNQINETTQRRIDRGLERNRGELTKPPTSEVM